MAKFLIGGEDVEVDLPTFAMLKRAWVHFAIASASPDPMQSISAILVLVAIGDVKALPFPKDRAEADAEAVKRGAALEELMTPIEMTGLKSSLNELMIQVGLAKPPGEKAPAGVTENPSPATSTPSSAPSSPA